MVNEGIGGVISPMRTHRKVGAITSLSKAPQAIDNARVTFRLTLHRHRRRRGLYATRCRKKTQGEPAALLLTRHPRQPINLRFHFQLHEH